MFSLSEQHQMVEKMVRQWCAAQLMPKIPALEAGEEMPFELMRRMARTFGLDAMARGGIEKRLARLRAAAEGEGGDPPGPGGDDGLGGAGRDPMMMFVVIKELSRCSPGFAMGFGVSVGLAGGAILSRGTPEQIERWGLPLATVDKIGSWCLTEPGAGSDAFGSMKTTARPDGDGFVLSGSKTFITNGPGADLFVVYARVDRGEPAAEQGVAAFVLERGMDGFTVGPAFRKMGMRDSPTSEIFFDGVRLGREHLLGMRERGREGRRDTKDSLASERSGIPAMAWGIIEKCYEQSLAYVRERVQFGRPIGEFQAVQLRIADMYTKLKNVENIVYRTAWMQTSKVRDPAFVNASKAYCSQVAVDVALTAIQIHGGYGYMEEYHVEKLARDAKLLELGAGTTDINLMAAARSEIAGAS
jgi:acyl-CoA dehydrogenase